MVASTPWWSTLLGGQHSLVANTPWWPTLIGVRARASCHGHPAVPWHHARAHVCACTRAHVPRACLCAHTHIHLQQSARGWGGRHVPMRIPMHLSILHVYVHVCARVYACAYACACTHMSLRSRLCTCLRACPKSTRAFTPVHMPSTSPGRIATPRPTASRPV